MTHSKDKCPWCKGVIGDAYEETKKKWDKITPKEQDKINSYSNEPLDLEAIKHLMLLEGYKSCAYDAGGHPWIKGGPITSSSYLLALYGKEYIKLELQIFDGSKFGRKWTITDKGREFITKFIKDAMALHNN